MARNLRNISARAQKALFLGENVREKLFCSNVMIETPTKLVLGQLDSNTISDSKFNNSQQTKKEMELDNDENYFKELDDNFLSKQG